MNRGFQTLGDILTTCSFGRPTDPSERKSAENEQVIPEVETKAIVPRARLLFDENPLIVLPSLAKAIGLNEAIVLQQVHYWVEVAKANRTNLRGGYHWTYNTLEEWQRQFPFWSVATVRRTIDSLKRRGLLVVGRWNKMNIDQTRWYRVDYDKLNELLSPISSICANGEIESLPNSSNCAPPFAQNELPDQLNLTKPIPETSLPEISSPETSFRLEGPNSSVRTSKGPPSRTALLPFRNFTQRYKIQEEAVEVISYFIEAYQRHMGKDHPALKPSTWKRVSETLFVMEDSDRYYDLSIDDLKAIVDHYFTKSYQAGCNYAITHFNNPEIKRYNFYEACY